MKVHFLKPLACFVFSGCTMLTGVSASTCDGHAPAKGQPQTVNAAPTLAPTPVAAMPQETVSVSVTPVVAVKSTFFVVRLQSLLKPVAEKVDACRNEVAVAQDKLCSLQQDLSAAEHSTACLLEKLVAMKEPLNQKGCKVRVGDRLFSREAVAEALRLSIDSYKHELAKVAKLTEDVSTQTKEVERLIAKAKKWENTEKELLSEVAKLQDEQKSRTEQARKNAASEAQRVAATVESMLDTTKSPSNNTVQGTVTAKPVSTATPTTVKEEQEVLAAVNSILQSKN